MRGGGDLKVTQRDRLVLGPLAEHHILITPQIAMLLGVTEETADRRMRRMRDGGLAHYHRILVGAPGIASITRRGLDLIEQPGAVPPPVNLRAYRHDVGVGWLWLGARNGAFGEVSSVITEQTMRAADQAGRLTARGTPHGLGLGLLGPHGRPQRHYPDLLLHCASGHRVAVELELTAKSRARMTRIMTAFASDARIDAIVYLVPTERLARHVRDAASRAGIPHLVDVRRIAADQIHGVPDVRAPSRVPSHAAVVAGTRGVTRSPSRAHSDGMSR